MYTLLISLCGLFFSCHGLSLSSGQSPPEPSQNDELWESINQVLESIEPMAIHAKRRSSLAEKPRRPREGEGKATVGGGAPASGTSAKAGTLVNGTRAASNSTGAGPKAAKPHLLLGGHHKTGARLLESIELQVAAIMRVPKAEVAGCPHFKGVASGSLLRPCQLNMNLYNQFMALPGEKRILHLTRDPLKLVVAGYVYHRQADDGAFSKKWSPEKLRRMSIKAGLARFASFAMSRWLKDMVAVHTAMKDLGPQAHGLTMQLEDFSASEEKFNAASAKTYNFLSGGDEQVAARMLNTAKKFGLFNRTKEYAKTIASLPEMTRNAYQQISRLPRKIMSQLLDMRLKLDYNVD